MAALATVTVFGAATQVGASICRHLANDYNIRAISGDVLGNGEMQLSGSNISIVNVKPSDFPSIKNALCGSSACIVITTSDLTNEGYKQEVQYGKKIADACAEVQIGHVIFNTQLSAVKTTGVAVPQLDAKAEIEEYMHTIELPMTGLILPIFYEGLLVPPARPARVDTSHYTLNIPMGNIPLSLMSVDDVGPVLSQVLSNRTTYLNKTLSLAGDKLTMKELTAALNKHLHPKTFKDLQFTHAEYRALPMAGAPALAAMFEFFCRVDQRTSVDITKRLHPGCLTFDTWFCTRKQDVLNALEFSVDNKRQNWGCM